MWAAQGAQMEKEQLAQIEAEASQRGTQQAQSDGISEHCINLDYQIEQELRPVYDQKVAQFDSELFEYNKKWLPAPSYTNQLEQMQQELLVLDTQLTTLIDQYNYECAS
jgi:hypothetical protein